HPAWYEGGQMPLQRRIPKRGFSNIRFSEEVQVVNLETIARLKAAKVDPTLLKERGAIQHADGVVKILGNGELTEPVEVTAHQFSKSAKDKIEKAGGKAITQ
ncbi:50S ribosomal protein L15, partial [Candidatus Neomarinimicrobiota bacterium]